MPEICKLIITPGDEEMWIECSCGWVLEPSPWRPDRSLDDAFQAWYWPHGIKSQIAAEEAINAK